MKKFIALILSLCMCFTLGATALAADIESDGGSGNTPVYLSSTEDGSIGGSPAATAMSVTIPTSFPMAMSQNGDVTTADNCRITNNSYGAVRVKSVTITAANGWKLTAFGNKSTLAKEKVDSNKFGFAIKLGNGTQVKTDTSSATSKVLIAAPTTGCYMSGVGDTTANFINSQYAAIVTPLSQAVTNANIADVVFVVEWDI